MKKVFDAYAQHIRVQPDSHLFFLDGERISETKTAKETGLQDGDEIDCFIEQTGGGGVSSSRSIAGLLIETLEENSPTTFK
jgi:small ubiquitin-related modifier